MAVYDKEKEKTETNKPESHDDLGMHPERREAEVADLEKQFDAPSATDAEQDELDGINEGGDWETNLGRVRKRRFNISAKGLAVGGGATGFAIGGVFAFFTFSSGPFAFIHATQLLDQFHFGGVKSLTDNRAGSLIRYARTVRDPTRRNLGTLGNNLADRYETKLRAAGITPQAGPGRRFSVLIIDTNTAAGRTTVEQMRSRGFEADIDSNGLARVDIEANARTRRQILSELVDVAGVKGLSSAVGSRTLKVRYGVDFHPLKNIARAADEDLRIYARKVLDDQKKRISGDTDSGVNRISVDEEEDEPRRAQAETAASSADDLTKTAQETDVDISTKSSSIKSRIATGAGAAGFIALTCSLKSVGDEVGKLQQSNIIGPLLRTGMDVMTVGSQVMAGKGLNAEELGVLFQKFYDKSDGSSFTGAESIQKELGHDGRGQPMPSGSRPGQEKPEFFVVIDNVINAIPGGQDICGAVTSTVGGFIIDVVGWVSSATGPVQFVASVAADQAQNALVSNYIDDFVRWLAGEAISTDVAGATFGNYANYGAFLAANDQAISLGGRKLDAQQTAELKAYSQSDPSKDPKNMSLYTRLFDPYQPNSLLAKTVLENPKPQNLSTTIASIVAAPVDIFSQLGNQLALFNKHTSAQSPGYDYGIPKYGFSVNELEDDTYADPYANADYVEPRLETLNQRYGKCFGVTVNPSSFAINTREPPPYVDLENSRDYEDCRDNSNREEYIRYRFYIADRMTIASLQCYEGDEMSCSDVGFSPQGASQNSGVGVLPSGTAQELARQIMDSGRVTFGDTRYRSQVEDIANGVEGCYVDPVLLQVMAALAQTHTYSVSSLNRQCTNTIIGAGTSSLHWVGKAVDIGTIDGRGATGGDADREIMHEITGLLPNGSSMGQVNCSSISVNPINDVRLHEDTCNHIHFGVPR